MIYVVYKTQIRANVAQLNLRHAIVEKQWKSSQHVYNVNAISAQFSHFHHPINVCIMLCEYVYVRDIQCFVSRTRCLASTADERAFTMSYQYFPLVCINVCVRKICFSFKIYCHLLVSGAQPLQYSFVLRFHHEAASISPFWVTFGCYSAQRTWIPRLGRSKPTGITTE